MPNHQLEITANNQPTVLERLLQVTRYRGFLVKQFEVCAAQEDNQLAIKLTVEQLNCQADSSGTGLSRLYHQLTKLIDIKQVDLIADTLVENIPCQA